MFVALLLLFASLGVKKSSIVVLVSALLLGSTLLSLRQYSISQSRFHQHFDSQWNFEARVRTDPVALQQKVLGRSFALRRYSFLASTAYGPVRVIAPRRSVSQLLPGERIYIAGRIVSSKERRVAAMVVTTEPIRSLAPPSRWQRSLAAIRSGLRNASGGGDAGALIPGMVIGDTAQQSADFKNDMRRAGLTHLVAVSGANFAIVSAFVLWCMQFIFRSFAARLWVTAMMLSAFIALVRPTPSVLRAAAMAAVALVALGTRQRSDALPALGFAIAAVIFIDPWQARDPGFALSVLATAGLLLIAPKIIERCEGRIHPKVATAIAPPIAALALCLPIIVALSGYISPMSIVANIVAAPFVAPITVVGFIAALISPLSPILAHLLISLIRPFATVITSIARWAAHFPVLSLRTGLVGSITAIAILLLILRFRMKGLSVLICVIAAVLWCGRFPTNHWQVFSCDVGQGDATILNLHHHRAIVIDVGPDPTHIDGCLKQLHINEIPLLILTHPHADHIGGLSGARKNRKVGEIWFGNIAAGTHAAIGEYSIDVLWPLTVGAVDANPNNVSIAAVIKSRDLTLFASGDIEPQVQEKLRGEIGRVDIYKVAHHGSRFQDRALMRELSPTLALISAGVGNSYGHPAQSTIADLEQIHAKVLRTDLDGSIAVEVHHHRVSYQRERSGLRFVQLR